jgi:hypothetical protein
MHHFLRRSVIYIAVRFQRAHTRPMLRPLMLPQILIAVNSLPILVHKSQKIGLVELLQDPRDAGVVPIADIWAFAVT